MKVWINKINDVVDTGKQSEAHKIFIDRKDIILEDIKRKSSLGKINRLEEDLNKLLYGGRYRKGNKTYAEYQKMVEQKQKEDLEAIKNVVDRLSFTSTGNKEIEYNDKNIEELIKLRERANNKLELLRAEIKNLDEGDDKRERLIEVVKDLAEQRSLLSKFLNLGGKQFGKIDGSIIEVIKNTEGYLNLHSKTISSYQLGINFEIFVKEALNKFLGYLGEELSGPVKKVGGVTTQRGVSQTGIISYKVSLSDNIDSKTKKELLTGLVKEGDNYIFKFDPTSKKMGKTDISIDAKYPMYPSKLSLKRWTSFSSPGVGSFGSTDILSAIIRANGKTLADKMTIFMLDKSSENSLYPLIRLSLMSDIIMGLNQKRGYATTVVVDTGKEIKVYDISDLITNNLDMPIIGLPSFLQLNAMAHDSLEEIKKKTTSLYLGLQSKKLKAMKVRIVFDANNKIFSDNIF